MPLPGTVARPGPAPGSAELRGRPAAVAGRVGRGRRQLHLDAPLLRRVAHAGIGTALVAHFQGHAAHGRVGLASQHRTQLATVGFNVAEEFVVLLVALRQGRWPGAETGADQDHGNAMPVQVITVGDLPLQLDAVAVIGAGTQRERLVYQQQVGFGEGQGGQAGKRQRTERGQTV